MAAAVQNIVIFQGADYSQSYQITDASGVAVNLTGATFLAKIRRKFDDVAALISFVVTNTSLATGQFTLSITAANTTTLAATSPAAVNQARQVSLGFWDLTYTLTGVVYKPVEGTVILDQQVNQ